MIIATMARPATQAEEVVSSDIDTQDEIVPTGSVAPRSPATAHRWWAVPLAVAGLAVLLVILLAAVVPASLVAETPADDPAEYARVPAEAQPVAERLSFDAVERYPAGGEFLFVTVREPSITVLDWFVGNRYDEVVLLSRDDKFGVQTPQQQRQINVQLMRTAKETAEYVALEYLGYPVEIVPGDVIVRQMVCLEVSDDGSVCERFAPSDEVLDPGDTLLSADGVALETLDDLAGVLRRHEPGDVITIEFERPGEGTKTGDVELIASDDGTDRTIIGFVPFDTAQTELPFQIDIDSGAIGGPSAGLAFTLTLIDELTPGELSGGLDVAVTGTINIDGTVGAIGGLVQKTSAVKQLGANVFLVPADQGAEQLAQARAVAGDDLEVIAVANLGEALAALAERGGNGLELGRPGESFRPPE
jgi:PDZ domain-containing protein